MSFSKRFITTQMVKGGLEIDLQDERWCIWKDYNRKFFFTRKVESHETDSDEKFSEQIEGLKFNPSNIDSVMAIAGILSMTVFQEVKNCSSKLYICVFCF